MSTKGGMLNGLAEKVDSKPEPNNDDAVKKALQDTSWADVPIPSFLPLEYILTITTGSPRDRGSLRHV